MHEGPKEIHSLQCPSCGWKWTKEELEWLDASGNQVQKKGHHGVKAMDIFLLAIFLLMGAICWVSVRVYRIEEDLAYIHAWIEEYDLRHQEEPGKLPYIQDNSDWEYPEWMWTGEKQDYPEGREEEPEPTVHLQARITYYCPCEKCCGILANGITATGTTAVEGQTIAVDPSVIPYGAVVEIFGHKYIAEDCGGGVDGTSVDIYVNDHQQALQNGVQYTDIFVYMEEP